MKTVHLAGLAFEIEEDDLVITDQDGNEVGRTPVADAIVRVREIRTVLHYWTIQEGE